jgi:hypothetical protein
MKSSINVVMAEKVPLSKRAFLTYELGILTIKEALSTRDDAHPVYARAATRTQRGAVQDTIRAVLPEVERQYTETVVSDNVHMRFIAETADRLSIAHGDSLHNGRFRIGIAQKLINLYLKYLWSAGLVSEPPHCPLDGIVRDIADIEYDWTFSDSIENYRCAIDALRRVAKPKTLAVWELEEFRRRAQ